MLMSAVGVIDKPVHYEGNSITMWFSFAYNPDSIQELNTLKPSLSGFLHFVVVAVYIRKTFYK